MTHEEAMSVDVPLQYIINQLSEAERVTFEEHYFSCSDCADLVQAMQDIGSVIKESGGKK